MKPIRVLMIEDSDDDSFLIKEFLYESDLSINLEVADKLDRGIAVLADTDIDVVLLDPGLPGSQGLETFNRISAEAPHIPIILLTGHDDQELGIESISRGAQDYLIKEQITSHLLSRSIRYAIQRKRNELEMKRVNRELRLMVKELKEANQKILDHQKTVIEEERLKVLLQISGTTAHELSQPITSLLGNIELMKLRKDNPGKLSHYMELIESSGQRIADIAKRISTLPQDEENISIDAEMINFTQKINVLALEDNDQDYKILKDILKKNEKITLSRAVCIKEALDILETNAFDLVVLDYVLPDGNGLDFFKALRDKQILIPVVVITAYGDETVAAQLIKEGAYDYFTKKDLNREHLYRSINNALEKFRLKREIKLAWAKMAQMATKDDLTGLYNRRYFLEIFEREVDRAKRYNNRLVFCMIDLDHFKRVNDTYGHLTGDMVLAEVGKILMKSIRLSDLVCRYGGEEFAVILPSTDIKNAELVCERLRKVISEHQFQHKSYEFKITISVGAAMFIRDSDKSYTHLLEKADRALYQAKESGRNRVVVWPGA